MRREIRMFLGATFAISYTMWFVANRLSLPMLGSLVTIVPALCAVGTKIVLHQPLGEIGWRLPGARWLFAGWLIPIAFASAAYAPLLVFPAIGGLDLRHLASMAAHYRIGSLPLPLQTLVVFLIVATFVTLLGAVLSVGEEIGWRGLLVPTLTRVYGERAAALISGIVWALWHYPLILIAAYQGGSPRWDARLASIAIFAALFSIGVVLLAIVFAWLRLRSGSVWTTTLSHGSLGAIVGQFFSPLLRPTPLNAYLGGEFGPLLVIAVGIIAVWCWLRLDRKPPLAGAKLA